MRAVGLRGNIVDNEGILFTSGLFVSIVAFVVVGLVVRLRLIDPSDLIFVYSFCVRGLFCFRLLY